MDNLFDICVELLKWLGGVVNLSYKEINIWVFVIIEPIIFILMLVWIIRLKSKINKLKIIKNGRKKTIHG
tara:strand:- start:189 stop:398 length:210 start_codon:yes stop_codon:yes gene_type:complete